MSFCRSVTSGLATAPEMPRPTEAGKFGIERTMARAFGNRALRLPMVFPARMETTKVSGPASGASVGAAASSICGFIPKTRASGIEGVSLD